jgi:hypothetical protein
MSGRDQGDERKRTTDEASKAYGRRQNWRLSLLQDKPRGKPAYCRGGVRRRGGVTLIQALVRNMGTCGPMVREKLEWRTHKSESTDAGHRGGITRSSEEVLQ